MCSCNERALSLSFMFTHYEWNNIHKSPIYHIVYFVKGYLFFAEEIKKKRLVQTMAQRLPPDYGYREMLAL